MMGTNDGASVDRVNDSTRNPGGITVRLTESQRVRKGKTLESTLVHHFTDAVLLN